MQALQLRDTYSRFLDAKGFTKLPEHPVVNTAAEGTYFNGSALTPNLGLFSNPESRPSHQLYTQQRVFWTRYADLVNHSPVWTIAQVMMSYYLFKQDDLQEAFNVGFELLTEQLGLSKQDLYVVLPPDPALSGQIVRAGGLSENIVQWSPDRIPPFKVDGLLEGFYCRFALKYKHGVLPIFDVVHIVGPQGELQIDSCLLLERLAFVLQDKQTWYETEMFRPLVQTLEGLEGSPVMADRYAYQAASIVRSVLMAIGDGADLTGKGKGHVVKKIIRNLLHEHTMRGCRSSLARLVAPGLECLRNIGYDWTAQQAYMESVFETEEKAYQQFYRGALTFLNKQVQQLQSGKTAAVTPEMLLNWKDSRGIAPEMAVAHLAQHGFTVAGLNEAPKSTGIFFTDCLLSHLPTR